MAISTVCISIEEFETLVIAKIKVDRIARECRNHTRQMTMYHGADLGTYTDTLEMYANTHSKTLQRIKTIVDM